MDVRMTWTVLYKDSDNNLLSKVVDAPHGAKDAWSFILNKYDWTMVAIIAGMHDIYQDPSRIE